MNTLLAIDPGTRFLGWAGFVGGKLRGAGCSHSPAGDWRTHVENMKIHVWAVTRSVLGADIVALESMTVRGGDAPTPPQDLINVQTVGCLVARSFSENVVLLTPSDWKATIKKSVHHPRILAALDETERGIVGCACDRAGAHAKEILDAVGIGLYYLKRTDKGGGIRA